MISVDFKRDGDTLIATWRIGAGMRFHKNLKGLPKKELIKLEKDAKVELKNAIEAKIADTTFKDLISDLFMKFRGLKVKCNRHCPKKTVVINPADIGMFLKDIETKMVFPKKKKRKGR